MSDRNDLLVCMFLNSDYGIIMNSRYDYSDASLSDLHAGREAAYQCGGTDVASRARRMCLAARLADTSCCSSCSLSG